MKSHISSLRVRYSETDQMGVVHHGNYAQYFEMARIEWLEELGISYKSLEEQGIMLPVYRLEVNYKKPALFDDQLYIETSLVEKPGVKIDFEYTLKNEAGEVLTTAETTLVFLDAATRRPIRCPEIILQALGFA